jgi:hypothetical protein
MVLEAGYPGTTGFRKVVKVSVFVKKREGLSDAEFVEHYNKRHAQMAATVLLKHNIISYSLVSSPKCCLAAQSSAIAIISNDHCGAN